MVEFECPMCDGAVTVAFNPAELGCRDCGLVVETDLVETVLALAA